jgi:formyl-CoA transferase
MVQRVPMPAAEAGEVALLGHPIHLSATPAATSHPPPLVGEHRDEILRDWLGIEGEERDALVRSGAFG